MSKTQPHCRVTKFGESTTKKVPAILPNEHLTIKKHLELIELQDSQGCAFLFPTGILVDWTPDASITQQLETLSEEIFHSPLKETLAEEYQYQWSSTQFSISNDTLHIPRKKTKILLAISYALSQSTQLDYKEQKIEHMFNAVEKISHALLHTGNIGMDSKNIRKMIGNILYLQHDMSMYGIANDHPEVFWEKPELAAYYQKTAAYLELHNRFEVTNQKVSVIQNALDVLRDEANVKHSHILEWIIIILICLEFLPLLFDLL